ncbi:hypothetical protein [uncultured Desulfovibrio sp.]|uniref:hypothetical protein n=1 Tax=uncultured Desulfovibrio sp. TaxID=167968 RepID=UPI002631B7D7|nr:hypothetical protein [uncultured Desulfovibrio sp.]
MAFALVNPVSALWQRRGLTTLLMPEGYDAFAAPQQEASRAASANAHSQARTGQPARERQPWQQRGQQQGKQQQSPRSASPVASREVPPQRRPHMPAGPDTAHAEAAPAAEPSKAAAWLPLPPHVWPAPWQARLEQTRPGPILWTYWNLGPDLCDPQTPGRLERRQFLQRLLKDLGHPAGTHTFWPSCLPPDPAALPPAVPPMADNGFAANADVFWSGAAQLRARGVVVMGSAAANAVALPGGLRPPQQIRHRGKLVWVLWDVDNLLQFDQRYASMLALLREALRHILR